MTTPLVLTVVLNYRTAAMTEQAVAAAVRAMEGIDGEIVVVDNDSGDGSFDHLVRAVRAAGWSRVRVVESGRNGGFGAGNNFGIRTGLSDGRRPDYVYLLNSDAFPAPDAIRILVEALESRPQVGFAGSHIHGPDGEPHNTAFRFPTVWSELEEAACTGPVTRLLARHVVSLPLPREIAPVDWLAGASLFMRRAALDEIGLFDEGYFLYYEETDLCLRAGRAGWPTIYVPESRVAHIGSASTGMKSWRRTPRYWFDSRLRYFTKNHGATYAAAATLARLAGGALAEARRLAARRPTERPRFLRDLAAHALGVMLRPAARTRPKQDDDAAPQIPSRSAP
ncbi:glycosyltransferase family 2 protein [Salinarimonas sp.]|uniref:glycosyltransferase family 2 protein n=1 Tax=Salinarimonas sp. TaxID=2766526 RepID=UPI0032D8E783